MSFPRPFALLLLAVAVPAWPHAGSNAFLFVDREGDRVNTRIDLAVRDLDELLVLDADGDGRVTWREAEAMTPAIRRYVADHLHLHAHDVNCQRFDDPSPMQAIEHADGWYVVLNMADRCDRSAAVRLEWSGVFDVDASHRVQVRWRQGSAVGSTVLSPGNRTVTLGSGEPRASIAETFGRYLYEGVVHVLTGLDHLLFLAGLFLPVALERTREGWRPVPSRRAAFARAALIVTAFTAAHAVSLCVVALGIFHPPTRLVESLVAFSVAFAGFNNIVPLVAQRRLSWLAAGFGLIHGAAIGGALLDLGLPVGARTLALAAFNLGVECAQLLPVCLAVVITFAYRESTFYRRAVLLPGSAAVTVAGLVWLTWRAFELPNVFG